MTKLPNTLSKYAAAAALGVTVLAFGASSASAYTENRCTTDGDRCATYDCNWNGCHRITDWRYTDRGYYYGNDDYAYGRRVYERCSGDRCATFRCDADGDRCSRISSWHYRY